MEYLNKPYDIISAINDFAIFIGADITLAASSQQFLAGYSTAGNVLGEFRNPNMILSIIFNDIYDVENIKKIKALVEYLKPPYLDAVYNTTSDVEVVLFRAGSSTTGNTLGQIVT